MEPRVLGLGSGANIEQLRRVLADLAEKVEARTNFVAVVVKPERLLDAARRLKELGFDRLLAVTAIDEPERRRIRMVYHVESFEQPGRVVALETAVSRDEPRVPSLTSVWEAALLQEREEREMLGVSFEGHPDPRRLLLPPDWPDGVYPLRKDYRVPDEPIMAPKPSRPLSELKGG